MEVSGIHWMGVEVGLRTSLENVQRKKSCLCQDSNSQPLATQPTAIHYTKCVTPAPRYQGLLHNFCDSFASKSLQINNPLTFGQILATFLLQPIRCGPRNKPVIELLQPLSPAEERQGRDCCCCQLVVLLFGWEVMVVIHYDTSVTMLSL